MRPLKVVRVYSGPRPRTLTFCPSPPAVREIATPVMWLSESATLSSGNLPSSSALMESCTVPASRLSSTERPKLARTPETMTVSMFSAAGCSESVGLRLYRPTGSNSASAMP